MYATSMPLSPIKLIIALCTAQVFGMLPFAAFPTLLPVFLTEWQLNNTQAGWISGIYFGGYVAAVGILTALTDRIDPKRVYLICMLLSTLATLGFALAASGVWSASLWRFLQGVGLAGTYMPGLKALTDRIPERMQSRCVAFYTSSFGLGASASIYLSGSAGQALDWQWAFTLCATGPLFSLMLAFAVLETLPPVKDRPTTRLLDFRPVLSNRRALGFTFAYSAHNAELFGFRSWIVAFLIFCQSQQQADAIGLAWSAATLAALFNLFGMPASVITNEIASRFGRERTLYVVMGSSAATAMMLGFSATMPYIVILLIAALYACTIAADSATITAGAIAAAEPRYRGTTMAMYSLIGFIGSFIGPIVFGIVLDLAGGSETVYAWGFAFAAMGLIVLLGPLAIARLAGPNPVPDRLV